MLTRAPSCNAKRAHPPCSSLPCLPLLTEMAHKTTHLRNFTQILQSDYFPLAPLCSLPCERLSLTLDWNCQVQLVSGQCLEHRGPSPNAEGWWPAWSGSGEPARQDMAVSDSYPSRCPSSGEVEAGNYICMWPTEAVWGTVIIGDLDLQKHLFPEEPLATYNELLQHFSF